MKTLFALVAIVPLLLTLTSSAYAWDDCPRGLTNDPYPGECSRYIDTDNDGICDHSQPAPENRTTINSSEQTDVYPLTTENKLTTNDEKHYTVEISGQEIKTKTIQEIADLWGIDSQELLSAIIDEFDLQGYYKVTDTVETLRNEYRFSPSQLKTIAEDMSKDQLSAETPTTQIATTKSDSTKNLIGITLLTLPLILLGGYIVFAKIKESVKK